MHLVSAMQTKLAFLPRIIVAVVLVLALLSGIAPYSSASAGHLCTMECCAGMPPHAAGSCHMDMPSGGKMGKRTTPEPESKKLCGIPEVDNGVIKGITAGVMGMKESADSSLDLDGVTIDAADHCNMNSQSEDANTPSRSESSQPASIAAHSFSKPCPPECSTGAISSGVRPSRDATALAYNAGLRSPTLVRKYRHFNRNFLIASACGKQVRPRGPPRCFG